LQVRGQGGLDGEQQADGFGSYQARGEQGHGDGRLAGQEVEAQQQPRCQIRQRRARRRVEQGPTPVASKPRSRVRCTVSSGNSMKNPMFIIDWSAKRTQTPLFHFGTETLGALTSSRL